jgi:hypothetical protein
MSSLKFLIRLRAFGELSFEILVAKVKELKILFKLNMSKFKLIFGRF